MQNKSDVLYLAQPVAGDHLYKKNLNRILLILVLLAVWTASMAQRSLSLLGTGNFIGAFDPDWPDVFSAMALQPALSGYKTRAAGLYGATHYAGTGTLAFSAVAIQPVQEGSFGLSFNTMGLQNYRQWQAGLGYGMKLNRFADIGVRFNYHQLSISGYGMASSFPVEAGISWEFTAKLRIAVQVYNPFTAGIRKSQAGTTPTVFHTGFFYRFSDQVQVMTLFSGELHAGLSVLPGICYTALRQLQFRAGFNTGSGIPYLACGYRKKNVRMHISVTCHPYLGLTSGIGLQFSGAGEAD
jgi:hypothetical protein